MEESKKNKGKIKRSTSNISRDSFKRETDLETIKSYLQKQKANNQPIVFYYRQDVTPRRINNYYLDDKYIHVKSAGSYYITFLINKIRKI